MLKKTFEYTGHKFSVYALEKNDENSFFSADGNGTVALWQKNKNEGKALIILKEPVFSLKKFRDILLIGTQWGNLFLLQGKKLTRFKFPYKAIFSLEILENSLFIGTEAGILLEFNLSELSLKNSWKIANRSLRSLAFSKFHRLFFIGDSEGNLSYFHPEQGKILQKIKAHSSSVFTIAYYENFLFSGSRDSFLKKWEVPAGKLADSTIAHQTTVNKILLLPEKNVLITAGKDAYVMAWQMSNLQNLTAIKEHRFSVNNLLALNSGTFISGGDDNKLLQWEIES